jgi:ACR3 family arsenite efflux pump ArsB
MSVQRETTARKSTGAELGFFERCLTLWVTLCIIAGIGVTLFVNGMDKVKAFKVTTSAAHPNSLDMFESLEKSHEQVR